MGLVMRCTFAFWPGSRKAWNQVDGYSLLVALLFAWSCILLWMATFVWPEWLPAWGCNGLWIAVVLCSLTGATKWILFGDGVSKPLPAESRDQLLVQAQTAYLQADYFEAEKLLLKVTSQSAVDAEASLLLVSVLRRTGRFQQALDAIGQLQKRDRAAPWLMELSTEKEKCLRGKRQSTAVPPPNT